MPIVIDLNIQSKEWLTDLPKIESLSKKVIKSALKSALPHQKNLEVSLVLCNDDFIQDLNKNYREKDKPTNVLSFPNTEYEDLEQPNFISLGDIIVAYETTKKEAISQEKPLQEHYTHLLVHGTLHLLHYDHETDSEAEEMETLEIEILSGMGIKNPYETV